MKHLSKIILGSAALAIAAFTSCKEEATLGGADAVYIEIAKTDFTMFAGDTVKLEARVSNVAGKDIVTPVTWSVDDESVVRLIEVTDTITRKKPSSKSRADGGEPVVPGEGEGEDPETPVDPGKDDKEERDTTFVTYPVVIALQGAQGKSTNIRATLENGQFAMTNVTVGRRSLANCIEPEADMLTGYWYTKTDTAWFRVNPISVVDDYDVSFELNVTERLTQSDEPARNEFSHHSYGEQLIIDRKNSRVGVVYVGPHLTGKGECVLTIGNEAESVSASIPIMIFPAITAGFEYVDAEGNLRRPSYVVQTPSNPKPMNITQSIDINSTYSVGVCLGVSGGFKEDKINAKAAEDAGFFKWEIEGNAVICDRLYRDEDYAGGYVSYIQVRSGATTGDVRITYSIPGLTFDRSPNLENKYICDLSVENYNVDYPVNRIVVRQYLSDGLQEISSVSATLERPSFALEVLTDPDTSFPYHIPVITSSDESVVTVLPRGLTDGYSRRFDIKGLGSAVLHISSLDKTVDIPVTVSDAIQRLYWRGVSKMSQGQSEEFSINVDMYSGNPFTEEISYTVDDPSIIEVTPVAGQINKFTVKALKAGTATLTAQLEGKTATYEVVVVPIEDVTVVQNAAAQARVPAKKNLKLYLMDNATSTGLGGSKDGGVEITSTETSAKTTYFGSWTGTEEKYKLKYKGIETTGCTFNFTIEEIEGDNAHVRVNGTVTLPNGQKFMMDNLTVQKHSTFF